MSCVYYISFRKLWQCKYNGLEEKDLDLGTSKVGKVRT